MFAPVEIEKEFEEHGQRGTPMVTLGALPADPADEIESDDHRGHEVTSLIRRTESGSTRLPRVATAAAG